MSQDRAAASSGTGPECLSGSRGLCDRCRHQRLVATTRGSSFSLCELSRVDPAFPRYPRLPVLDCSGFAPLSSAGPRSRPPS